MIEKKLVDWGYEVVTVADGEEAWHKLKDSRIRLVILDWMMPGLDGIELCKRLRRPGRRKYTYTILLTARSSMKDVIDGLKAGADDYMKKPINFQELEARLQTALRIIGLEDGLIKWHRNLARLARTDSLMGIWNRPTILNFIKEEVDHTIRRGSVCVLFMIDVDGFKNVNDNFGHAGGDRVLRKIAACLKANIRPYDRVGRYGGDEILALLRDCDLECGRQAADRILKACRNSVFPLGRRQDVRITVSIGGVSSAGRAKCDLDSLLAASDTAVYEAKRSGKDAFIMYEDLEKRNQGGGHES